MAPMGWEDSDSDSDGWGEAELVIPPRSAANGEDGDGNNNGEDDDDWAVKAEEKPKPKGNTATNDSKDEGKPMIIVDVTSIDANIHSKHDRNSVNDPEAASKLRKKIEQEYNQYAKDTALIASGTVIPCGASVWRDALSRLRDDRPGHYFVPIFPPK